MKKIIILSLLAAWGLSFTSCNDDLDLKSDGSITMADVFNDRNRTRGYLNGCYDHTPGVHPDAGSFTDDAQDSDDITSGSIFDHWYNEGINAVNFGSYVLGGARWEACYIGIRRCNVFLANIDASTAYATNEEKVGWKSQAYVLRAFYYLELFKRYGQVPLLITDRDATADYSKDKKATIGEIVNQILSDCDLALSTPVTEHFPWGVQNNQWKMMNRAIAYAIKSQAVTFATSPLFDDGTITKEKALEVTKEALGQCLSHDYSLFTETDGFHNAYGYYFLYNPNDLRAKDKETIYGGTQVAVWSSAGLPTNDGMTKSGCCPTQDLVDCYEMNNGQQPILGYSDADHLKPIINASSGYDEKEPYKNRDPRFYMTVYYNGALRYLDGSNNKVVETYVDGAEGISDKNRKYTRTGYYLHKYNHFKSDKRSNSDGYVRFFRLPELYFNFAELAYQVKGADEKIDLGNGTQLSARDAVNIVRARAGMPELESGMNKSDFEKRYRNERRVEFAMEQIRYFDVRRWKIINETEKFVTGMEITKNGDGSFTYNRFRFKNRPTSDSKFLLFPLDVTEVSKMLTLTGDNWQNPGWD